MKNILSISIGIISSVIFCSLFLHVTKEENTEMVSASNEIKAFQIGAFKDQNSANSLAKEKKGVVIKDNDYYLVYVGILKNANNIKRLTDYLNDKNIYYYVKTIELNESMDNELFKYEELMRKTSSDVAFMKLNNKILEIIGESYENKGNA